MKPTDSKPDKLQELAYLCKCSISIQINPHRDFYQSIDEWLSSYENENDEITEEILAKMRETDTYVSIQAYPDTPIGFYHIIDYDINTALDRVISAIKNQ